MGLAPVCGFAVAFIIRLAEPWRQSSNPETATAKRLSTLVKVSQSAMVVAQQHQRARPAASRVELLRPALEQAAASARQLELPHEQALSLFDQMLKEGAPR